MANISFYGSHNSSITIEKDGKILEVIEIERFFSSGMSTGSMCSLDR
jgi:cytoskeletal protein CcmA (bactofilin family)